MPAALAQIVHYVAQWGDDPAHCLAAVTTLVPNDPPPDDDATAVSLAVFTPRGHFFVDEIPMDEGEPAAEGHPRPLLCTRLDHEPGTWHVPVEG
ncbi:Hypothetical protein AJAP_42470 (plasmid) [Amycolatopsis japonica]|uniref:Uncharacterized protein n=1 Tax=Amycolatopsis japonica TaxID=208439 RepID=A0A075VEC0_9PSEU|nr:MULTISPECIES: hypothetical protein [Amycolatopsis]AIG81265.1 Hypothetical protein AJAP_42470 [Amycolatopsis japonica]RSN38577.1 hypothetical protein DMC64_41660 [Amycolatopsis sp. WAC 04197]